MSDMQFDMFLTLFLKDMFVIFKKSFMTYGENEHLLLVVVISTYVVTLCTRILSSKATPAHLNSIQAALSLKFTGVTDISGTGPTSTIPYNFGSL